MLESPIIATTVVPKSDVEKEVDVSLPLQNEATKDKRLLNKEGTVGYVVFESTHGTNQNPTPDFTMAEVKEAYGDFTFGVLLQAMYETYMATTHPGECVEKDVWGKIRTNMAQIIEMVVLQYLDDPTAFGLSYDVMNDKYNGDAVCPKGPKQPKCHCDDCEEERMLLKEKKWPENSADRDAYAHQQTTVPEHAGWGKGPPQRGGDQRPVLEAKGVAAGELGIDCGASFSTFLAKARARLGSDSADCEGLPGCRSIVDLFNADIKRVTDGVDNLADFYPACEEAIGTQATTFSHALGGQECNWKVHFEPENDSQT